MIGRTSVLPLAPVASSRNKGTVSSTPPSSSYSSLSDGGEKLIVSLSEVGGSSSNASLSHSDYSETRSALRTKQESERDGVLS